MQRVPRRILGLGLAGACREVAVVPEEHGQDAQHRQDRAVSGGLYTIVSNKESHNEKGTIVAMVHGTKSEDVIAVLEKMPKRERDKVDEITLDMANNMRKIARTCLRNAKVVIDRFHVYKLASKSCRKSAYAAMTGHRRGQQAEERGKGGRKDERPRDSGQRGHVARTPSPQPLPAL